MLALLTAQDYHKTPWKNGNGITEDVLLLPAGASHDDFEIRISRAPILGEAAFSAFPGIDRTITRLSENPLVLSFPDGKDVILEHLSPYSFDSGLSPASRLPAGAAQVMNVMTRRGCWRATVTVMRGNPPHALSLPKNSILVVYTVCGACNVAGVRVRAGETVVGREVGEVTVELSSGSASLVAILVPVGPNDSC